MHTLGNLQSRVFWASLHAAAERAAIPVLSSAQSTKRVKLHTCSRGEFGTAFAQVEQVDEASGNAMAEATTAVVEAILEPLRPAMVAMRAKVEVGASLEVVLGTFHLVVLLILLFLPSATYLCAIVQHTARKMAHRRPT